MTVHPRAVARDPWALKRHRREFPRVLRARCGPSLDLPLVWILSQKVPAAELTPSPHVVLLWMT